jgi:hypothetical protein
VIEWFDDLGVGMRFKSQEKVVTREEIKRFASEFDPQPFHLDEAAAEQTPLRGLAASGWHTAAIAMRLAVEVRPFGPHPLLGTITNPLRRFFGAIRLMQKQTSEIQSTGFDGDFSFHPPRLGSLRQP